MILLYRSRSQEVHHTLMRIIDDLGMTSLSLQESNTVIFHEYMVVEHLQSHQKTIGLSSDGSTDDSVLLVISSYRRRSTFPQSHPHTWTFSQSWRPLIHYPLDQSGCSICTPALPPQEVWVHKHVGCWRKSTFVSLLVLSILCPHSFFMRTMLILHIE